MSEIVTKAVETLNEKLSGASFDGSAKFVIDGEGSVVIDSDGARASDDDTDVTLTATPDVFEGILDGSENPTAAFMTGKLSIDGDMGAAMKLAALF